MIADPARLRTRRIRALAVMSAVAVAVLTADAMSKALVLAKLPDHPPVRLLDGLLTLDLTLNAGAAFGVGTSYTAVIALIVCGVIVYIIRTARRLRSLAWTIALGLLLGGAMGNLGDRLFRAPGPLRGRVVDWVNLPHFPWTFNLADASITCAAVLIAVLALRGIRIDGTSPAHAADRNDAAPAADRNDGASPAPTAGPIDVPELPKLSRCSTLGFDFIIVGRKPCYRGNSDTRSSRPSYRVTVGAHVSSEPGPVQSRWPQEPASHPEGSAFPAGDRHGHANADHGQAARPADQLEPPRRAREPVPYRARRVAVPAV